MTDHDELPLMKAAREREEREIIARRCSAVERACRAIGFARDSGHELIARLVARVAGTGSLARPLAEIADDHQVGISYSYARRCVNELAEYGVLSLSQSKGAPTKRRGRPEMVWILTINWGFIEETNLAAERFESSLKGDIKPTTELMTDGCRDGDERVTNGCRREDHTIYPPNTLFPCPQSPGVEDRGSEDFKFGTGKIHATVEGTSETALKLFRSLGYRGTNGSTLWLIAAVYDAGELLQSDIAPSARRAFEKADTVDGRVGYFRNTLRDRIGLDSDGMRRLLGRVDFGEEAPSSRPVFERCELPSVNLQAVPAIQSIASRKAEIQRELAEASQ